MAACSTSRLSRWPPGSPGRIRPTVPSCRSRRNWPNGSALAPPQAAWCRRASRAPAGSDRPVGRCRLVGMRTVTVNDKMQQGYRYELVEPVGRNFHPDFKPDLSPREMLELGVFGGKYMTDCRAEFPKSWFARAKLSP